jgi:4-hydroxy-3-polyprenylbenzoate decarboxylase
LGIDATAKVAGEGNVRPWPVELRMSADVRQRVEQRWKEFGLDDVLRLPLE